VKGLIGLGGVAKKNLLYNADDGRCDEHADSHPQIEQTCALGLDVQHSRRLI